MPDRTKIVEVFLWVGDDGSGTGEGVLSMIRAMPPELAHIIGLPVGMATSVLMIAYDRETAKLVAAEARKLNKQFRVLRFDMPEDVTAQFSR